MSIFQIILGLACAATVLFVMWQIAIYSSKFMIQNAVAPPGLSMLKDVPAGVKVVLEDKNGNDLLAWHRGSGPAVVIIPESGFTISAYTPLWELLCGYGFRVILFQPAPASIADPDLASDNLERVLLALSVRSPLLIGHGFGAYTAYCHQLDQIHSTKTQASGIVSVSGFAGKRISDSGNKFGQLFQRISNYQTYLSAFGKDASAIGVLALQTHTSTYPWDYLAHSWPHISSFYSEKKQELPVTIIGSIHDEILPFSHSAEMKMAFPAATLHTVKGGEGHMLIWETPSLIVEEIRSMEKASRRMKQAS